MDSEPLDRPVALHPPGGTFTQDCSDTVPWIRKQTALPCAYIVATFAP